MFTAFDMSTAGTSTSGAFNTLFIDNIGLEIISTGTPTGTYSFEASNDSNTGTDGTWFAVTPASPPANPSGAGATVSLVLLSWTWAWLRMKYARTSGTGTLDVIACGKEI
jgi:hypothetical protein